MAEPTYFAGVVSSAAAANKYHLTLWNGTGSGKTVKIYRIKASGAPTAAVTGLVVPLGCFTLFVAAPTAGAVVTPERADLADPSFPITGVESRTGPTVVPANQGTVPFGVGEVSGEEAIGATTADLYEAPLDGTKPFVLPEGRGACIKQGALASAGAVSIVTIFTVI
jgi:hypothetical protein